MFEVFKDEWTQANVTAAAATAKKLTLVASGTSFVWSESTQTEYYVINGDNTTTSFDAETDGANGVNGNTILNSGARQNEGNMIYTIYYKPIADNSYQDKSFNFQFKVQALQLRNNASPDWTGIN
jgi:hypothetical protein